VDHSPVQHVGCLVRLLWEVSDLPCRYPNPQGLLIGMDLYRSLTGDTEYFSNFMASVKMLIKASPLCWHLCSRNLTPPADEGRHHRAGRASAARRSQDQQVSKLYRRVAHAGKYAISIGTFVADGVCRWRRWPSRVDSIPEESSCSRHSTMPTPTLTGSSLWKEKIDGACSA